MIMGHESDARAGAAGAAVADHETHDARIEVDHAVEVGGVHAKMRELGRKGHGVIVPPDPGAGNGKGASAQAESQGINPVWRCRRSLAKLGPAEKHRAPPQAIDEWQGGPHLASHIDQ